MDRTFGWIEKEEFPYREKPLRRFQRKKNELHCQTQEKSHMVYEGKVIRTESYETVFINKTGKVLSNR